MEAKINEITIRVLGFYDEEENKWCAVGLEVDILGYGDTFQEACKDLNDLILMQISFAVHKGRPSMIWRNTDPQYFELFEKLVTDLLFSGIKEEPLTDNAKYDFTGVPFPSPQVIAERGKEFINV